MFDSTMKYAKLAWGLCKRCLRLMNRKIRWVDLALLPFGLCVLFLLLLGKLFGLTYKQISVVFNLWIQGAILTMSGMLPFVIAITWLSSVYYGLFVFIFALYGFFYVYFFVKMLRHYHLPFDYAFDLCVEDLQWLAKKWHTTYQIVNLIIFVVLFLILIGFNLYISLCLIPICNR